MLLLDSEALSALAQGPASRRDRVRALIVEMRRRELPAVVATVDLNDLRRLAAYTTMVSIVGLAT